MIGNRISTSSQKDETLENERSVSKLLSRMLQDEKTTSRHVSIITRVGWIAGIITLGFKLTNEMPAIIQALK